MKRPFKGGGALKARNRVKQELESEKKSIHQAPDPQSFHNMTTGTAHVKRPFVGGGAFKERSLANRALESERKLRELMGMLLEARTTTTSILARLLEAGDDEKEWEDIADGEDCEDIDDEDEWEDIDDDEELEEVENEDDWEDIDDDEDWEDAKAAESVLLSSLRTLMQTATLSSPSGPPTQTHILPETSR